MRSARIILYWGVAAMLGTSVLPAFAHEEQVVIVGRTAAGGLKVDSDFDQPIELPVSIFPGISGYATGELALHSTIVDDPANDFFQLSTAADFRFVLLSKDQGIEVWNGSGFMNTNDVYHIGPSPFDVHPIWNIVNGIPGNTYSLALKLRDLNGVYEDSEPFTLTFSPVPPQVQVRVRPINPQQATLSWPTNSAGWKLQWASSLAEPTWVSVTNFPSISGTNFSLMIDTVGGQRYFRLFAPITP